MNFFSNTLILVAIVSADLKGDLDLNKDNKVVDDLGLQFNELCAEEVASAESANTEELGELVKGLMSIDSTYLETKSIVIEDFDNIKSRCSNNLIQMHHNLLTSENFEDNITNYESLDESLREKIDDLLDVFITSIQDKEEKSSVEVAILASTLDPYQRIINDKASAKVQLGKSQNVIDVIYFDGVADNELFPEDSAFPSLEQSTSLKTLKDAKTQSEYEDALTDIKAELGTEKETEVDTFVALMKQQLLMKVKESTESDTQSDTQSVVKRIIAAASEKESDRLLSLLNYFFKSVVIEYKDSLVDTLVVAATLVDETDSKVVPEINFKSRRDDFYYNKYLDEKLKIYEKLNLSMLKEHNDVKSLESSDKTKLDELLKKAMDGYTPSLWKDLPKKYVDLISTEGNTTKYANIINIPVLFNFDKQLDIKVDADSTSSNLVTNDKAYEFFNIVMKDIRDNTCINFYKIDDKDVVKFESKELIDADVQYIELTKATTKERGCDEIVGRIPLSNHRPQQQPFSQLCLQGNDQGNPNGIAHYFMHHLGFDNEHQRPDSKDHVTYIKSPMLQNRSGHNETREEADNASFLTGEYDIQSIMHWSKTFTSGNENQNITHMRSGQQDLFSPIDYEKINTLYQCKTQLVADSQSDENRCNLLLTENNLLGEVNADCLNDGEKPKASGAANVYVQNNDNVEQRIVKAKVTYKTAIKTVNKRRLQGRRLQVTGEIVEPTGDIEEATSEATVEEATAEVEVTGEVEATGEVEVASTTVVVGVSQSDKQWMEEYELSNVDSFTGHNDMVCGDAKIFYRNGDKSEYFCSEDVVEEKTIEITSGCGVPLQLKYESSNGNSDFQPILKVEILEYSECEQAAALEDISSSSTFGLSIFLFILA